MHDLTELVDPSNPANDPYYTSLRRLRSLADTYAQQLRPKAREMVRLTHAGHGPTEIAKRLECAPQTVVKNLKRQPAQDLLQTLRHAAHLVDGPKLELRRNMLWRIAVANEEPEPNVAITALKELNKLAGSYPLQAPQVATVTNITINGEQLPRTVLDSAPEHTE